MNAKFMHPPPSAATARPAQVTLSDTRLVFPEGNSSSSSMAPHRAATSVFKRSRTTDKPSVRNGSCHAELRAWVAMQHDSAADELRVIAQGRMPGLRSSGCPRHEWGRGAAGRRCWPSHACPSSAETGSSPGRSTRSQHAIRTLSTPARARRRSPGARLRVRTARNRAGARARARRAGAERRRRAARRTKVEVENRVGLAEDDVHAGADVGRERRGGRQPAGVVVRLDLRRGEHAAQEGARRRGRVQEQKGGEAGGGGRGRVVQVRTSLRRAGLSAARAALAG